MWVAIERISNPITATISVIVGLLAILLGSIAGFAFCWIAVALPELGHCLAGWSVGARLIYARAGPVGLRKIGDRWTATRAGPLAQMSGLVLMLPRGGEWTLAKLRWCIAGGPIMSVAVFVLCVVLVIGPHQKPHTILEVAEISFTPMVVLIAGSLVVSSMWPFPIKGWKTDLLQLFTLHQPSEIRRRMVDQAIGSMAMSQIRPREWDRPTVEEHLALADGNASDIVRYLNGYWHYSDCGDNEAALGLIERAGELSEKFILREFESQLALFNLAIARAEIAHDSARARQAFDAAKRIKVTPDEATRLRALVQLQVAESDHRAARETIARCREACAKRLRKDSGLMEAVNEDLDRLLELCDPVEL